MSLAGCSLCRDARDLDFDFSFAFQPIVDLVAGKVIAYEALVRGCDGSSADSVLGRLTDDNRYAFDQAARSKAIAMAAQLMPSCDTKLSINILPNAVYDPVRCLSTTLNAAETHGFALSRLMFEMTEHERVRDVDHLRRIIEHYTACGFSVAIDDFGAGFAGLTLLADFVPDIIKLDMSLVRNVDAVLPRQAIVTGIVATARLLDVDVLAEGVESAAEVGYLRAAGVRYFQGYLFAKPAFEALPEVDFAAIPPAAAVNGSARPDAMPAAQSVAGQPVS